METRRPRAIVAIAVVAAGLVAPAAAAADGPLAGIDGVEVGTGTPTDIDISYDLPSAASTLGAYMSDRCTTFLVGDIDGVSIWKKALPVADIARVVRSIVGGR